MPSSPMFALLQLSATAIDMISKINNSISIETKLIRNFFHSAQKAQYSNNN